MSEPLIFTDGSVLSEENNLFVVLAEDDLDDQEFFTEAFSKLSTCIKIFIANNGNKVLQILNDLPANCLPLLIILDYNLPELNGADILEKLSGKMPLKNVPKLVWSTSGSPVYRQRSLDNGAQDYLVKPADFVGLQDMVKKMYDLCRRENTRSGPGA